MVHFMQVEIAPFQIEDCPMRVSMCSRDRIVMGLDRFEQIRHRHGRIQLSESSPNKRRWIQVRHHYLLESPRRGGSINRRSMKASEQINAKAAVIARQRLSEIQDEIDRLHQHLRDINRVYSITVVRQYG